MKVPCPGESKTSCSIEDPQLVACADCQHCVDVGMLGDNAVSRDEGVLHAFFVVVPVRSSLQVLVVVAVISYFQQSEPPCPNIQQLQVALAPAFGEKMMALSFAFCFCCS